MDLSTALLLVTATVALKYQSTTSGHTGALGPTAFLSRAVREFAMSERPLQGEAPPRPPSDARASELHLNKRAEMLHSDAAWLLATEQKRISEESLRLFLCF